MADVQWHAASYRQEDLQGLLDLAHRNRADADFAFRDYAEWQYHQNPAGPPVIEMARDTATEEIVGQYVLIPIAVQIAGKPVGATLSLNTLTDERFRGKGIFTKLAERVYAECANRKLAFTYGFPNQNSAPGFKKMRFLDLGNVPMLVRPVNWGNLARAKTKNAIAGFLGGVAGAVFNPVSRMFRSAPLPAGYTLKEIRLFDARWDAFWERNAGRFPAMVARNAAYLNWRFITIPRRTYRVWCVENAEGCLGYIALRFNENFGLQIGFIIDFFVDQSEAGATAGRALVAEVMQQCEQQKVDLLATHSVPHSREYAILRSSGLWVLPEKYLPRPTPVIVRTHLPNAEQEAITGSLKNWYLTLGDYDNV